ncbi:ATP-dependent DNA helicase [Gleimia sp. 6138-11-ORH1]|uniref:ATP-dependent DNA helicase n=1 Tax=Gleimia sp. 6138-11-ORH1 TaxID=2973937 RepID=UPI0021695DFF|nr:ATP-dependent DNA helicase [Gleimia sp. 6138-11-ORH1]MCS4484241.1 ATP-dependent DNA helicase [Gleimia sp. 6138-11-ORH1]
MSEVETTAGGETNPHLKKPATAEIKLLGEVVASFGGSARRGQEQMVQTVSETFATNDFSMIQAGTGTGKSLGYLVPLMNRVSHTDERILVSTATLALQRQILEKDVPLVNAKLEKPVQVAALKGWNNYLCLHRVQGGYAEEYSLFGADWIGGESEGKPTSHTGKEIVRVRQWAAETDTGDRDDLVPGVSEQVWRQVSVVSNECLGTTCPLREECFAVQAREKAAQANVVITNHTILGIHATSENKICGDFSGLVVDEAHDLVRIVHSQATIQLYAGAVVTRLRWVGRLLGLDIVPLEKSLRGLEQLLEAYPEGLLRHRGEDLQAAVRLVDVELRSLSQAVSGANAEQAEKKLAYGALNGILEFLTIWDRPVETTITWITRRDDEPAVLNCVPLDVSGPIAFNLFAERAVVLTSATLQLGGSFGPVASEVGAYLVTDKPKTVDVGTPFAPEKQGILYVPKHLEAPLRSGLSEAQLAELARLCVASGGGMLGLFSSYRAVQQAAEYLREKLAFEVLVQGDDQLSNLLRDFRSSASSCLLGTMSLWQGIDIKGQNCRLVVMDRIPFPVPSDPVVQARTDEAARKGLNPFQVVSLNHAALLMAQGAGRLLRSVDDRGMVAILDSRLATRPYGAYIKRSLPAFWPTFDPQVAVAALERLRISS